MTNLFASFAAQVSFEPLPASSPGSPAGWTVTNNRKNSFPNSSCILRAVSATPHSPLPTTDSRVYARSSVASTTTILSLG